MREEFYDTGMCGIVPNNLPGGFFIYEAEGDEKILFAENNIVEIFGCRSFEEFKEYTGGTFSGMVHPDDIQKVQTQIKAQTIFGEKRHDYVRYRIITKKGDVKYIEDFGHLLHSEGGRSYFYVFIVDVDQNEYFNNSRNSFAEAELLSRIKETDQLTGLFTMSFFYHIVQNMLNSPEFWRKEVAFIHFDIPNFKLYNERFGFKMGDELLVSLAKIIREVFSGATISRFSDDHFVVCVSASREKVISKVETVFKQMLLSEDVNKKVRVKAGIYILDDARAEIGLACDHARLACNSIKGRHDVNYCIYDDMLRKKMIRQQYVVDNIDEAVEKEYIKVFYQPVIRVKTGEICGYEALVRWVDPEIGMINPGDFIETLEQFHLIHLVDIFVIRKVCEDYARLRDKGEALVPVSVNISRLDFEICDVFETLEKWRKMYDMPSNLIDVEITESAFNDNSGLIKQECKKIRDAGYQIWIDDFGSGYSSLNTIADYEFDVLKLDMVFLRSLDNNPKTADLMRFIINGARVLGIYPLSEGVETQEHFDFLKRAGCEKAQGYFFGKPMPMEESRAFTREKGLKWET
ncbi:GGDEF and EAL domain-containing protein [Butyrivibrio sp. AE2015]|uniref:GGDEF and EAL domain-containing protein n=1 Tax=Butyrivibrio sp. AE2015 TaxID=1280663 RepID=UPI0003B383DD|nr:GGDEF and EAL domain-containing protein [Butyrivibrio sp. AE2015]